MTKSISVLVQHLYFMVNKDEIIPSEHSEELCIACSGPTWLIISSEMDHNKFYYNQDFLKPLHSFLKKYKIIWKEADTFTPEK